MTVLMTFNKEEAVQAGSSMGITESGAYIGTLEAFSFTKASNAAGVEFTLNSPDGKAQFLSLYHTKKDGSVNPMGKNMIQAIMGLLQINQITGVDTGKKDYSGGTVLTVPEFEGREIGLILQKELTTKSDGSDGYSFDIKMAFLPGSRKTLLEAMGNKPAVTVDKIVSTLKDKDSRKPQGGNMAFQQEVPQSEMPADFDSWG